MTKKTTPTRNDAQRGLTPEDVTSLCAAGQEAWNKLGPRGTKAAFEWRGKKYVARRSIFALMVDTPDGKPVAQRYD
jgi:hypothetical protein